MKVNTKKKPTNQMMPKCSLKKNDLLFSNPSDEHPKLLAARVKENRKVGHARCGEPSMALSDGKVGGIYQASSTYSFLDPGIPFLVN